MLLCALIGVIIGTIIFFVAQTQILELSFAAIEYASVFIEQVKANPTLAWVFGIVGTGIGGFSIKALADKALNKSKETFDNMINQEHMKTMSEQLRADEATAKVVTLENTVKSQQEQLSNVLNIEGEWQTKVAEKDKLITDLKTQLTSATSERNAALAIEKKVKTALEEAQQVK